MGQHRHRGTDGAVGPVLPHISANDGPRTGPVAATRRARGAHLLVMLLAAVLLVSCTPTEPVPSPTPSVQPTFQCTPESGEGDPTPCTSAEYEEMKERDALYAEAERILRRSHDLSYELWAQRLPINDELQSLLSGDALAENTRALAGAAESSASIRGKTHIAWVVRAPSVSSKGSIVALESCVDPGTFEHTENGNTTTVPPVLQQSFFVILDGSMRLDSGIFYEAKAC